MARESKPTLYRTRTHDGVRIGLWNYHARGERRTPVLLVHGLGSNRFDLDLPGKYSLARFLHEHGFDVWLLELRGAGASRESLKKLTRRWRLDDYLIHDIPAAFRFIEEETGVGSVHWAGHSLGGMLAYPILVTADRRRIRSCSTIGAPTMTRIDRPLFDRLMFAERLFAWGPPVLPGYRGIVGAGSFLARHVAPLVGKLIFNHQNIDVSVLRDLARNALEDVPTGVTLQFFEWYRTKKFRTHYGTIDVVENLERATSPLLVIAGKKDDLTPLDDVRVAFDRSGASAKELVICGVAEGFAADYGHVDLVFGRRAPDEIFPRIRDWMIRHDDEPAAQSAPRAAAEARL